MAGFPTFGLTRGLAAALLASALALTGCQWTGTRTSAPPPASIPKGTPESHRVRQDETLYSIAFRYGLDYHDVAAWNGIGPPYLIRPGDRIRLRPAYGRWAANRPPPRHDSAGPTTASTSSSSGNPGSTSTASTGVQTRPLTEPPPAPAPRPAEPVTKPADQRSGDGTRVVTLPVNPPTTARPAAADATPKPTTKPPSGAIQWRWPAAGEVIGEYSTASPLQRGLDFAGPVGSPIYAAAKGEVVYSGSGLVGYGELVIIKHDERYLSAYAHNRRRFVKEGEKVTAGQKIAELGNTGTNRAKLHFEIRENGQPINPRDKLPKR